MRSTARRIALVAILLPLAVACAQRTTAGRHESQVLRTALDSVDAPRVLVTAFHRSDSTSQRLAAQVSAALRRGAPGWIVPPTREVMTFVNEQIYAAPGGPLPPVDIREVATLFRATVLYDLTARSDSAGRRLSVAVRAFVPRSALDTVPLATLQARDARQATEHVVAVIAADMRARGAKDR